LKKPAWVPNIRKRILRNNITLGNARELSVNSKWWRSSCYLSNSSYRINNANTQFRLRDLIAKNIYLPNQKLTGGP